MSSSSATLPNIIGRRRFSTLQTAQSCARSEDAEMAERISEFLRQKYPDGTAKIVGKETGIPWKTVKNWLDKRAAPKAPHFMKLVNAYGLPFLDAVDPEGLPFLKDVRTAIERRDLTVRFEEVIATAQKLKGGDLDGS
ncbi:hypothetical protein [Pseudovibrio sp. POLY-S9]|uniref:hypothetical protein n=1 Tax=Pseudovibrio sp. POLY-S9 TaxID=1576596 RepID=UPI00070B3920|nr:hypothetical protein [Pseudovibrio sp. POLY-S9]